MQGDEEKGLPATPAIPTTDTKKAKRFQSVVQQLMQGSEEKKKQTGGEEKGLPAIPSTQKRPTTAGTTTTQKDEPTKKLPKTPRK